VTIQPFRERNSFKKRVCTACTASLDSVEREFDLPVHFAFPSTTDGGYGGAGADAGDDAEVGDGCVGHNVDGCLSHGATILLRTPRLRL